MRKASTLTLNGSGHPGPIQSARRSDPTRELPGKKTRGPRSNNTFYDSGEPEKGFMRFLPRGALCIIYLTQTPIDVEGRCALHSIDEQSHCLSRYTRIKILGSFRGENGQRRVYHPVAPVAYQAILEPRIGQFREFECSRVHNRINSWGFFLVHKLTCGKRESVS